ncbi:hypothetical protein VNI00_006485 [Paramarasmius palmivorus]|uniref:Uncharacterized protein n=1 Tax=Paramarasmius palmivorus TaxID=297713 RepID=A0AAW0D8X8_9AGAR
MTLSSNTTLVPIQGELTMSEDETTPKGKGKRKADDLDGNDGEECISKCVKRAHMEELQHGRDWSVIASALGERYCQPFRTNRVEDSLRTNLPTPSKSHELPTSTGLYQNQAEENFHSHDLFEGTIPSYMGVCWSHNHADPNTLYHWNHTAPNPIGVCDVVPTQHDESTYHAVDSMAPIDHILDAGDSILPAAVSAGPSSHSSIQRPLESDDCIQCRWGFETHDAQWNICGQVLDSFKDLVAHLEKSHNFLNKSKLNQYGRWDCRWLKWDEDTEQWDLCDKKRKGKGSSQGYAYNRTNIIRHIEKEPGIRKNWQPILVPRDE